MTDTQLLNILSLPARGVWIEIRNPSNTSNSGMVAPRKGSVD